ncbi:hypothetical protein V8G54_001743 [Vigna mungo]|uniref:Uncharacterized protein n=1 Tax=Vigna mungo TaxID=3915 RepID=A0AAQ3S8I1_VIGMU
MATTPNPNHTHDSHFLKSSLQKTSLATFQNHLDTYGTLISPASKLQGSNPIPWPQNPTIHFSTPQHIHPFPSQGRRVYTNRAVVHQPKPAKAEHQLGNNYPSDKEGKVDRTGIFV